MTVKQFIKNICKSLGNNNKSIYPVVAIATANGIFRPAFTMLKKGENPESKKYAALRECLTEIIAVPTYWFSGVLLGKCGKKIVDKAMDIKFANMEKNGKLLSENVKLHMKNSAIKKGQSGLMLIGVCFAAGVIIPGLCSACVTPIMNKIKKENITQQPLQQVYSTNLRPAFKSFYGMKVGGL